VYDHWRVTASQHLDDEIVEAVLAPAYAGAG
jgi:hypothetical protein